MNTILKYFLLSLFLPPIICTPNESRLIKHLLRSHDPLSRPAKNDWESVQVTPYLSMFQLLEVNEKKNYMESEIQLNLYWKDESLSWLPNQFGNISMVWLPPDKIWSPDVLFLTQAAGATSSQSKVLVSVNSDGVVSHSALMVAKTSCVFDVTWFPFDAQFCQFYFAMPDYTGDKVLLALDEMQLTPDGVVNADLNHFSPKNGQWHVHQIIGRQDDHIHPPTLVNTGIRYTIFLERKTLYYFFNLLVPSGLIGFLAVLGFTLPPDSGEKLPLGVTVLFSLIVFHNEISNSMPANSEDVSMLATYFNCVMTAIALSVVSPIVINLNKRNLSGRAIEGNKRKFFLCWLPWLLRMEVPPQIQNPPLDKDENDDSANINKMERVQLEWKYVAIVVDRVCLLASILFSIISVGILLYSAHCRVCQTL